VFPSPIPTAPDPLPANACGVVVDGVHRCGQTPVVARLTEQYAAGERTLLCAQHRAQYPETVAVPGGEDGEPVTIRTTEPVS
jgi:hypothetical protein